MDEFEDWCRRREEAHQHFRCDELEQQFDAVVDRRYAAQKAVLLAEAPDHAAVLVKLEILSEIMTGEQDCAFVEAIRDDSRRLLSITH